MEPGQEETVTHHAATESTSSAPRMRSNSLPDSIGSPTTDRYETRAIDHDSLVTVRLSEPPVLSVNTSIGTPTGKSPFGHGYTPSDAMAETVPEEDDGTAGEPDATSQRGKSLQDELQDIDGGSVQENDDTAIEDGENDSDDEQVDWDSLQESEDKESKDQESDNVSLSDLWDHRPSLWSIHPR